MRSASSGNPRSGSVKDAVSNRLERIRLRIGASRGQFATLCLLLIIGGTVIARPAGMLLWHRLRIITGMPRMAVATPDPTEVAQADPIPDRIDPGRPVVLDDFLVRDPFSAPMPSESDILAARAPENATGVDRDVRVELDHAVDRVLKAASLIRLSGTANGLGTALLDGAVRRQGDSLTSGTITFTLREVRSGEVVLEHVPIGGQGGFELLLTRSGARLLQAP